MFNTVAQLKDGVAGILTGIDLDNVVNVDTAIQRAARMVSAKISIPEASARMAYMIYDGVYDYLAPASIFGGSFTDFRPQGAVRNYNDYVYRKQVEDFDRTKSFNYNGVNVTFEYQYGTPILRVVSARVSQKGTLDTCTQIGNWVADGSASTLIVDSTVIYQEPGALLFTMAANAGVGYIQETFSNPINLKSYQTAGVIFVAVMFPDITSISSVTIKLGNNSLNYYQATAIASMIGPFVANKYILLPFYLSTASLVGTVNLATIQYAQIAFNQSGSATSSINIRVGAFFISLPSPYELLFQTAAIFMPNVGVNAGIPQQAITNDNDQIILSDDAYNIFEQEAALAVAIQSGSSLSSPSVTNINTVLNGTRTRTGVVVTYGIYDLYRSQHPSEEIKTVGNYYDDENIHNSRFY